MTTPGLAGLRARFATAVDALVHSRASEVPEADVAAYVSLDWLEWHGGSLRLTTTGENIRRQLRAEAA